MPYFFNLAIRAALASALFPSNRSPRTVCLMRIDRHRGSEGDHPVEKHLPPKPMP